MVEWRAIPGFGGKYEVSDDGQVRSIGHLITIHRRDRKKPQSYWRDGVFLAADLDDKGYRRVGIYDTTGRRVRVHVHILMALTFIGPRPEGMFACHNDGNRQGNLLSNLRYDTPAGNSADMIRHGTVACGERVGMAKLTEAAVREIRCRPVHEARDLAERFGVSKAAIYKARAGDTWSHIGKAA